MLNRQESRRSRPVRARLGLVALAAAVLVSTGGCATRASDEAIVAALRGPAAPAAAPAEPAGGTGDVLAPGPATGAVPEPGITAGEVTGETGGAGSRDGAAVPPTGGSAKSKQNKSTPERAATASKPKAAHPAAQPATARKPRVANKSPIAIGTLGAFSGVLGAVTAGSPRTIAAWVADANAHGGVNGHPVKLVVGDDQADPSTSLTLARRLVENDKVLAFVGNIQFFGFAQVEQYLRSKNVPMVGGDFVDPGWVSSPITFPVSATVATQIVKGLKMYVDAGDLRMAMLYCLEVGALCQYLNDQAKKSEIGKYIEQSYQVSLVAPSYTSQCLRMKQADLEVVYMLLDTASAARVTKDCATQGFTPKFMLLGLDATKEMPSIPSLSAALIPGATASPGATDLPGVRRYLKVMKTFAPSVGDSGFGTLGWAAAELFGLAGKNLSDNPTTAELFEGLYRVKNETFGGMTVPLTFTKAKRWAKPCVFIWGVADNKFSAPQGSKPLC